MIYRKIWIPSKQKFYRIRELSVIQYKNLLKSIDDGFFDVLGDILIDNARDPIPDDITIFDRFIILLYLKIYSCGAILELNYTCDKCGTVTKKDVNLNELLDILGNKVDNVFKRMFKIDDNISIICDIPSLKFFDESIGDDLSLENYLYMYIQEIVVQNQNIALQDVPLKERPEFYKCIAYDGFASIKKYSTYLRELFSSIEMLKMECASVRCAKKDTVNFSVENMNQSCRFLFLDDNFDNIIYFMGVFSEKYHVDYRFYENITPLEANLMIHKEKAQSDLPPIEENDNSLLEHYYSNTKSMVESPSEFK